MDAAHTGCCAGLATLMTSSQRANGAPGVNGLDRFHVYLSTNHRARPAKSNLEEEPGQEDWQLKCSMSVPRQAPAGARTEDEGALKAKFTDSDFGTKPRLGTWVLAKTVTMLGSSGGSTLEMTWASRWAHLTFKRKSRERGRLHPTGQLQDSGMRREKSEGE